MIKLYPKPIKIELYPIEIIPITNEICHNSINQAMKINLI